MYAKALIASALASNALGHMVMTNPKPYPGINNSPLEPSGSDFPCKSVAYTGGASNAYKAGDKVQLQFQGTAVHGGGSCQISVTYDNPPTKDSAWKVIHSIIGGCPARNTPGNLPGNDAALPAPDSYEFSIPKLPDGEAVLAWTWFNRVGNREMYMNCAPITISGGGNADILNTLPDMMVANIASHAGCTTAEGVDIQFPNPGESVEKSGSGPFQPPTGSCGSAGSKPATPPKPVDLPAAPAEPSTPEPKPETPATPAPGPGGDKPQKPADDSEFPGGVFKPAPGTVKKPVEEPAAPPAAAPAAPPAAPPVAPATGGGGQNGACTQEGMFNCVGGASFQQCASGTWSPAQPMASGTKCAPGMSMNFQIMAA